VVDSTRPVVTPRPGRRGTSATSTPDHPGAIASTNVSATCPAACTSVAPSIVSRRVEIPRPIRRRIRRATWARPRAPLPSSTRCASDHPQPSPRRSKCGYAYVEAGRGDRHLRRDLTSKISETGAVSIDSRRQNTLSMPSPTRRVTPHPGGATVKVIEPCPNDHRDARPSNTPNISQSYELLGHAQGGGTAVRAPPTAGRRPASRSRLSAVDACAQNADHLCARRRSDRRWTVAAGPRPSA